MTSGNQTMDVIKEAQGLLSGQLTDSGNYFWFENSDCELEVEVFGDTLRLRDGRLEADHADLDSAQNGQIKIEPGDVAVAHGNQVLRLKPRVLLPDGNYRFDYEQTTREELGGVNGQAGAVSDYGGVALNEPSPNQGFENEADSILAASTGLHGMNYKQVTKNQIGLLATVASGMQAENPRVIPLTRACVHWFDKIDLFRGSRDRAARALPADNKDIDEFCSRFLPTIRDEGYKAVFLKKAIFDRPVYWSNGWKVQSSTVKQEYTYDPENMGIRNIRTLLDGYLTMDSADRQWADYEIELSDNNLAGITVWPVEDAEQVALNLERARLNQLNASGWMSSAELLWRTNEINERTLGKSAVRRGEKPLDTWPLVDSIQLDIHVVLAAMARQLNDEQLVLPDIVKELDEFGRG